MGSAISKKRRPTLRRARVYVLLAGGALLALLLLIAAGLTARLAAGPTSIAFLGPTLREALDERLYYTYNVKFDDLELRWSDGHGHLGLALVGVRVADYSLEDIASAPEIVVGLNPGAMITGDMKPAAITVTAPKIRWIKTAGGAIKFDIGAKNPGDSGKILEDFLITMAAAPEPEEGAGDALPDVRIVDADITIASELSGSATHIVDADILVAPHAEGVTSRFALAIETKPEPVTVAAEGLYRTSDQRIDLAVTFEDLAPASLGDLLPDGVPNAILDEPVTGMVRLDMDKFFSVHVAKFALVGEALDLAGEARMDASSVDLQADGTLSRPALQALARDLEQGRGIGIEAWLANEARASDRFALALSGSIQRFDQTLQLSGTIGPPETPFTVSGSTQRATIDFPSVP